MENQKTKWFSVPEIQNEYLPISKKVIRCFLKENLDIAQIGKKLLVKREQLEAYLRNDIKKMKQLNHVGYYHIPSLSSSTNGNLSI